MSSEKTIYTTSATVQGGRAGTVTSDDGHLSLSLSVPAALGGPGSGPIPEVYAGGLPDKVRDAVTDLPPGRVSPPIEIAGARLFVMVCSRKESPVKWLRSPACRPKTRARSS